MTVSISKLNPLNQEEVTCHEATENMVEHVTSHVIEELQGGLELAILSSQDSHLLHTLNKNPSIKKAVKVAYFLPKKLTSATTISETIDAILYDVTNSTVDTITADKQKLRTLLQQFPQTPIIAITKDRNQHLSTTLFSIGVADYLEQSDLSSNLLCKSIQKAKLRLSISSTGSSTANKSNTSLISNQHPKHELLSNASLEQQKIVEESIFRSELNLLMTDILSNNQDEALYQIMLDKAVSIIPGAQAGSVILKVKDGYKFVAAVGYKLEILSKVLFDISDFQQVDLSKPTVNQYSEAHLEKIDAEKSELFRQAGPSTDIKTALSIPITQNNDVIVIFNLDNFDSEDAFDDSSISMAQLFAAQIGALWQRISLEKSLREEKQQLQLESSFREELNSLFGDLLAKRNDDTIYQAILEKAVEVIPGAQAGSMALLIDDYYQYVAAVGYTLEVLASTVFDIDDFGSPKNWSAPVVKSYIDDNWHRLEEHKRDVFINCGPTEDIKSAIAIPILENDKIVLIFNIDNFESDNAFDETAFSMVQIFANNLEALWQRIQLEESLRKEQHRLIDESSFRAELNTLISDILSQDSDEKLYQAMLEKAVDIIPNAQAGSMAILTEEGFRFVAAVDFNLEILASTTFDYEHFGEPKGWSEPVLKNYFKKEWHDIPKEKQSVFVQAGNGKEIQTSLSIPVVKHGNVVIIFNLDNFDSKEAFDQRIIGMAQMFATQIAAIWQRFKLEQDLKQNQSRYKMLFDEADKSKRELELLDKVQNAIANKLELSDLYETVAETVVTLLDYSTVVIGLIQGEDVVRVATRGIIDEDAILVLPINQGITAKVIQSQKAELVETLSKHADALDTHTQRNSSLLVLPFFVGQEILGIMYVEDHNKKLNQYDVDFIQKVIDQLEFAIENAQLHEQVKTDLSRSHALHAISTSIQSANNQQELTRQVIETTREAVGASWAILYKLDYKRKVVEHVVKSELSELSDNPLQPLNFEQLQGGLTGWAIEHQELVFIPKGSDDPREHPDVKQTRLDLGFGSVIVAPLIYQNEALGVMALINHVDDADYSESDLKMVSQVSNQASIALAQHQLKQKTEYQAFHDIITALPNRFLFEDRLKQSLAHAERYNKNFAVLFLDLDGFKNVNDTLGHDVGDLLLKEVANRLSKIVRKSDTLARMGGDEFAIVLNELQDSDDALTIAQNYIHILQKSFDIAEHKLFISGSIGVSIYPKDGQDISTLLKHADTAMYEAKATGKNRVQGFNQRLADLAKERLELETSLRKAIELSDFELYYQPKINLGTGQCIGVEALIRWEHPSLGYISPVKFIPVAEESGLIIPLGEWIINEACRQAVAWHKEGLDITVAVNIASSQFEYHGFTQSLEKALADHKLSAKYLELEVTESMVMQNLNLVIERLHELRNLGVKISIDDFGTGYSSLRYLQTLPVDYLKIDRSFVDLMDKQVQQKNLVQTIISLADNFDLEVIAEGVETAEQLELLKTMSCQTAQGYFFSKPLTADDATAFIKPLI